MTRTCTRALLAPLVALALGSGCGHVPRSGAAPGADAEATGGRRPEKVLVTGSRIPRPVSERTGLPETFSPLRVYTLQDVVRAGPPGELGVALRRLDTAAGP